MSKDEEIEFLKKEVERLKKLLEEKEKELRILHSSPECLSQL